jgi:beta-N-acetylhexosaminidase
MTAHVAVPNVSGDEIPSTLNQKISTDILRKELNFSGIIITDAMEMGAIVKNYSEEKSVVMAVKAGADVVLLPTDTKKTIDAIEAAVKGGELTEARIDQSVQRLLAAKYKLGLTESRFVDVNKVMQQLEKPENVRDANATAEKSITLLKNEDAILPMNVEKARKTLFVVVTADEDPEEGRTFVPEILKRSDTIKVARIDLRSNKEEYDKTLALAANYENLVIVPFVKRAASKGTVALPEAQAEFIRQSIALQKPVAVIAFGNPYLIRQFPAIKNYVVTYSIEEIAQMAAIKTLFGEIPFQGKLPVSIPGISEVGAGLVTK